MSSAAFFSLRSSLEIELIDVVSAEGERFA
jgi:hypothetical protein